MSTTRQPLLSAVEMATDEIRAMIESGEFKPGQRINVEDLVVTLAVSRTPIRDALHVLKSEGLVDVHPRVGMFVRSISPDEVHDVYSLKAAVEPLAAEWAAVRGSSEQKNALSATFKLLSSAANGGNVRECAHYVDIIHMTLFDMAGSEVLREVQRVIGGRVKQLRALNMAQPGRLEASVRQHGEVVQAVVAGDPTQARVIMARHMRDAAASAERLIGN